MATSSANLKTIGILLGLGALTTRQAARVEQALEKGMTLDDAIRSLPMIEMIDLLRARRLLGQDEAGPTHHSAPHAEVHAIQSSRQDPSIEAPAGALRSPLARDEDGIPFLELEEPPGLPTYTPPEKRLRPVGKSAPNPELKPAATPKSPEELTLEQLEPMAGPGDSINLAELPTLQLGKDDGIPLVREVHALLINAPRGNLLGFQIARDASAGAVADYARSGKRLAARFLDAKEAERMSAHLKVAARLSPWRLEPQEGWMLVTKKNVRLVAHIHSVGEGELSRLTVSLFERFDG